MSISSLRVQEFNNVAIEGVRILHMWPMSALLVQTQLDVGYALGVLRDHLKASSMVLVAADQENRDFNGAEAVIEVECPRRRAAQACQPPLEALAGAGHRIEQHLHRDQRLGNLALVEEAARHARTAALVGRVLQGAEPIAIG